MVTACGNATIYILWGIFYGLPMCLNLNLCNVSPISRFGILCQDSAEVHLSPLLVHCATPALHQEHSRSGLCSLPSLQSLFYSFIPVISQVSEELGLAFYYIHIYYQLPLPLLLSSSCSCLALLSLVHTVLFLVLAF